MTYEHSDEETVTTKGHKAVAEALAKIHDTESPAVAVPLSLYDLRLIVDLVEAVERVATPVHGVRVSNPPLDELGHKLRTMHSRMREDSPYATSTIFGGIDESAVAYVAVPAALWQSQVAELERYAREASWTLRARSHEPLAERHPPGASRVGQGHAAGAPVDAASKT